MVVGVKEVKMKFKELQGHVKKAGNDVLAWDAFAKGSSSETSRDDDGWVVGGCKADSLLFKASKGLSPSPWKSRKFSPGSSKNRDPKLTTTQRRVALALANFQDEQRTTKESRQDAHS